MNKLNFSLILLAIGTIMVIISLTVPFKYTDVEYPPDFSDRFAKEFAKEIPPNASPNEIMSYSYKFFSESKRVVQKENKSLKYLILFLGTASITIGTILLLSVLSVKEYKNSKTITCPVCGTSISEIFNFCNNCGYKLKN